jgi:16S rRNA processing protein RimM
VNDKERLVVIGRITGVFGVRGWVRVFSYTEPLENVLDYSPWTLGDDATRQIAVVEGHSHGKGIVARIEGVADREVARGLIGSEISVPRSRFGAAEGTQFYWSDLLGFEVANLGGAVLGQVSEFLETGANDVIVVTGDRRRLVPFVQGPVVRSVDLGLRRIVVDWDEAF